MKIGKKEIINPYVIPKGCVGITDPTVPEMFYKAEHIRLTKEIREHKTSTIYLF